VLVGHHKAWITTHETEQMNTGDEIISINDVPASAIIDHGYNLFCGDGYTETFKELFLSEYDGFEDACNKYYHWTGPYRVKLLTTTGITSNITANPTERSFPANVETQKMVNNFSNWVVSPAIPDDQLRYLSNSPTALLKIPPFAYTDTAIYEVAFKSIKEKAIKNLILDMRHNSGGDIRIATQLLSYLADSPYNIVNDVKSRLPNPSVNHFSRYFDTSITSNFNIGYKTGYPENGWRHIDATPALGRIYGPFPLAKEAHFNGNLVVLIDGATFSSGALFTAALKAQRRNVKFVGRETAGSEEGCNGMTIQELTLPNTKIVVDFPWMRVVSVAKNPVPGHGIMPDFYVNYTPEDVVTNNDLDLKKALLVVRKGID
jgi:C-terminal processing protease CtpA/Prc